MESSLVGHGSCSNYGHCFGQRRSKLLLPLLFIHFVCKIEKEINFLERSIDMKDLIHILPHFLVVTQGKPPDWQDFVGIITLLLINSTISFIEENNAGNAAAALMARLAPKAKVCITYKKLMFNASTYFCELRCRLYVPQ